MTMQSRSPSGYSTWRLIAEELRRQIVDGASAPGTKLPSENDLAERFGVHRNTVRQAIAALTAEQLVVSRRGSGTFVADHTVLVHRIGTRTRLSDSLGKSGKASARLLDWALEPEPPAHIAERLQLSGRSALRLESIRSVNGVPISRVTQWYVAEFVPRLPEHFKAEGTITGALRALGIEDYVRVSTTVGGRHATAEEAAELLLPAGSVVLVVRALDALPGGTPLQLGITRFAASRVELDVEHSTSV
ncbi:phosphonate metabolism transcriptional regulator PhnF [Sinomonas albida]|uniref:phosphonate metabolism transcriptional regulator PhnF n=1 Tax=Sinomonas albida TaxID=369942 RepID=UPI0010A7F4BE|nr:phosphonate metabolism transcriptional regulator PhnF [Sinomonas albida]